MKSSSETETLSIETIYKNILFFLFFLKLMQDAPKPFVTSVFTIILKATKVNIFMITCDSYPKHFAKQ